MIPFLDLREQYLQIKPEIDAAISKVFDSGQFVLGDEVRAFEDAFARYSGVQYGVAVNSGTSALHLALLAMGVGPGDEVITVPFTFVATVASIGYTGARPVFVDIDPATFTMDVAGLERAITSRTKAIVPVHLYGHPADMDPILEIARRYGIRVLEDACQAHGAEYKGTRVGGLGAAGCFSFYPGKNLGAYGEGGIVVTDDRALASQVALLRDWGQPRKYHHALKGFNCRMEGLQGSILHAKLRHLERWTDARRVRARRYDALLRDSGLGTPTAAQDVRHVYHLYVIRTSDRAGLQRALQANGIGTGIHYPVPVHLQPAYADLGYGPGDFPESERAALEVLSLPMYPELSQTNLEVVAAAVKEGAYVG